MINNLNLDALMNNAVNAAIQTGSYLRGISSPKIDNITTHDIKLAEDYECENLLRAYLTKDLPFYGEESGGYLSQSTTNWVVDPIDGSINFLRHIPFSCISIGIWANGPILGVIYDFNRQELFTGSIKHSAKLNGDEIRVSAINKASDSLLFSGFPHSLNHDAQNLNKYISNLQAFNKVRHLGSAALSLAYVASGRGEVYMEESIKLWDVCAGLAILQAAGGHFKYTGIETMNVYASNGLL